MDNFQVFENMSDRQIMVQIAVMLKTLNGTVASHEKTLKSLKSRMYLLYGLILGSGIISGVSLVT